MNVGRTENISDRAFSAWCKDNGFGDIGSKTRTDAMWLARNWTVVTTDLDPDLTHPQNIRQASRTAKPDPISPPAPAPAPDVDLSCMKVNPELANIAAEEQESTAASRERWKLIGEALKVGREAHAGNQAFGAWCTEHGFGGIDRRVRADALWFAENLSLSTASTTDAHPTHIRQAHRKLTPPVKPKVYVEARVIPRVAARPPLTVHDAHLIEAIGSKVRRINALAAHAAGEGLPQSTHRELNPMQQRGIVEARAVLPKWELTVPIQWPRKPLHGPANP